MTIRRKWKQLKHNAFFEYTDKDGIKRIGKGRKFMVDSVELELFSSTILAAILGRSVKTIYLWEKNFNFPQSLWRIREEKKCNRWYSRKQLIAIKTIHEAFNGLRGESYKKLPQFVTAVRKVFFTIDQPIEKRGSHGGSAGSQTTNESRQDGGTGPVPADQRAVVGGNREAP